ncbi:MAG: sulfatase-like hydrolase/transferase, partial [Kiritimatiellales bacterium]
MNKRNFLTTAGIALAVAGAKGAESQTPARPNILWIMTDQQPADMMSCAGNANLRTPAMDSIATNGVRFELAYTVNPICVPSRTSMMTGRLPHETGVKFNLA